MYLVLYFYKGNLRKRFFSVVLQYTVIDTVEVLFKGLHGEVITYICETSYFFRDPALVSHGVAVYRQYFNYQINQIFI